MKEIKETENTHTSQQDKCNVEKMLYFDRAVDVGIPNWLQANNLRKERNRKRG